MIWIISIPIIVLLACGLLVDRKRKKRNDYPQIGTNPDSKPGDSSNFKMGDNHYTSGGN